MDEARRYAAEFLGTLLLVFFGVGSAVAAREQGGVVVVALCFGFIMLALVYTIGPLSGSHVNPAVTLGVLLSGKISLVGAACYWVVQFAGAAVAGFALWGLTRWGDVTDETGTLGSNGYGAHINLGGTMVLETILTFLFVLVVLVVTSRAEHAGFAGLAIGLALAAVHLVGITLDGTSVNPARSLGPAIFNGGTPLRQLWVFVVFPLLGGALAALVAPLATRGNQRYRAEPEQAPRHSPRHS
jgi:aquaporin Z